MCRLASRKISRANKPLRLKGRSCYNRLSSTNAHWRAGILPIPPPPSATHRQTPLRDQTASYLAGLATYPVFLTVQPNLGHAAPLRVSTGLVKATPEDQVWSFVRTLAYRVDQVRWRCCKPELLGPDRRLQGFVILECRNGNIHAHILITCTDWWDQFWTSLALFDLLDTVSGSHTDLAGDTWREEAWSLLTDKGWLTEQGRTRTHSPLLHKLAPGATAMVQRVRSAEDKERVCHYMTKEMAGSSPALARQSEFWAAKADLCIRELKEFHPPLGGKKPASLVRTHPETGAQTLDLDRLDAWKCGGRLVR